MLIKIYGDVVCKWINYRRSGTLLFFKAYYLKAFLGYFVVNVILAILGNMELHESYLEIRKFSSNNKGNNKFLVPVPHQVFV